MGEILNKYMNCENQGDDKSAREMTERAYNDVYNENDDPKWKKMSTAAKKKHKSEFVSEYKFAFHVIKKLINKEWCRVSRKWLDKQQTQILAEMFALHDKKIVSLGENSSIDELVNSPNQQKMKMISLVFCYLEEQKHKGDKKASEMRRKSKFKFVLIFLVLDDFKLVETEFDYAVTMLNDKDCQTVTQYNKFVRNRLQHYKPKHEKGE